MKASNHGILPHHQRAATMWGRGVKDYERQVLLSQTRSRIRSLWPRPGSDKPLEKTTFYTKVGDQVCGVGYYKG